MAKVQSCLQLPLLVTSINLTTVIIAAPTILTNASNKNVTSIGSKSPGSRN